MWGLGGRQECAGCEVGGEAFGESPGDEGAGWEDEDIADLRGREIGWGDVGGAIEGGNGYLNMDNLRIEASREWIWFVAF